MIVSKHSLQTRTEYSKPIIGRQDCLLLQSLQTARPHFRQWCWRMKTLVRQILFGIIYIALRQLLHLYADQFMLHSTPLPPPHHTIPPNHTTPHCNTSHYTTLHYTTLHYTKPNQTTPNQTTPHHTTPHYTTQYCTKLHYTSLHWTELHHTTPHHTTPHHTTPQYNTLHLMYNTVHKIMCMYIDHMLCTEDREHQWKWSCSYKATKAVESPEKNLSLQWDSNSEHHTSIAEAMGSNPIEASEIF